MDDLPDDLSWDAFQKQYGEGASETFHRQQSEIYHRILALPPYRAPEAKNKAMLPREPRMGQHIRQRNNGTEERER